GGGASGLELATTLGKNLGRKKLAAITLIDPNLNHLWKPLWHEVAAGTINTSTDDISYLAHAAANNFKFELGGMKAL
ncbi:FAD-dependent oxidoreductase, partial [Escherichia coli]|nr:FAD-dependent oxidoreductase [Escherichia coli]